MGKIRFGIILLTLLFCSATTAPAQVSIGIGIGTPNVNIGINLGTFPELVPVPGYPVYYAPRIAGNYFFYDGLYWVFVDDMWYASEWYDGPWWVVQPDYVPAYILRVPVRYYRSPPPYFSGWRRDAPPRWGHHWGPQWEKHRRGWDTWDRRHVPHRAPLPVYQRQYRQDHYPRQIEQQQELRRQHYRYQPRDKAVRQHFQQRGPEGAASSRRDMRERPPMQGPRHQVDRPSERPGPPQQPPPQHRGREMREQMEQPRGGQPETQGPRHQGREQREMREMHQEPQGRGHEGRRDEGRGHEGGRDEGRGRER